MRHLLFLFGFFTLAACSSSDDSRKVSNSEGEVSAASYIAAEQMYNPESVIPPQCYTKTNGTNNPCYVCHQSYPDQKERPNVMGDGDLQGNYEFSDVGSANSWKNLFVDRTNAIAEISDDEIMQWSEQDNYTPLIEKLNNDSSWAGEKSALTNLSDPSLAFEKNGLAKDGSHWIAYNYKPFPSTFWPTNGSTGDAMIRLPKIFREQSSAYRQDIYLINLSLLEMAIKDLDRISVLPTSEISIGQDLNNDQLLSDEITEISRQKNYIGDASHIELAHMLYPAGVEFLHTVRYLGVDEQGDIFNARRMKEVRYMKKSAFRTKEALASAYYLEAKEKEEERLPQTVQLGDRGIDNGFSWVLNGYIEDQSGALRQQHPEELSFCNGCHKTIGSTIDQTFSFARKVQGSSGWGYIDLNKIKDVPSITEKEGEYLTYMQRIGGGDEFRQNKEMLERWFNENGQLDSEKVATQESIYQLIMPSKQRALTLNKAYKTIVNEQSFIFGRDATLVAAKNVLQRVDQQQLPLQPEHRYNWDMRLNWQ